MSANGDGSLVGCLVDRLAARLPHRTGATSQELLQDSIVSTSRSTLVQISATNISLVLETILPHLEDLTSSYKSLNDTPPHVSHSLRYLVSLTSDCCSANRHPPGVSDSLSKHGTPHIGELSRGALQSTPAHLDDGLATRFLDLFKHLLNPLPEGLVLPAHTILGDTIASEGDAPSRTLKGPSKLDSSPIGHPLLESYIRGIVEYITASNWPCSFDYLRQALYVLRPTPSASQTNPAGQAFPVSDEESSALVFLRLLSFFEVDGRKLGLVIQEICSNFLHFRKPFQNTVCIVTSQLISRWVDRHPDEFIQLHNLRKRLDGSVDTLFDMTQAAIDNGRRKAVIYPLQIALLFLIPDAFEVAINLRQVKSSSMSKKVAFLDTLRKSLRNRNEHACYCLVSLLRAARHFDPESDAALVSFAMDVQAEVRDAVFRRASSALDAAGFEQDLMTAAFVSVTQLNLDSSVDSFVQSCLVPSAPVSFKLAVIQGCCYFAKQNDPAKYEQVFAASAPFMREQFQAMAALESAPTDEDRGPQEESIESNDPAFMARDILRFMDASPDSLFDLAHNTDDRDVFDDIFGSFLLCLASPRDDIRLRASSVAKRLFLAPRAVKNLHARRKRVPPLLKQEFWRRSSAVLYAISGSVRASRNHTELMAVGDSLEARVLLLKSIPELADIGDESPELAAAASELEMALLVSLCSADLEICQLVTTCIGYFIEECSAIEKASTASKPVTGLLRNSAVFRELASREFRLTGVVAFQKRVRGLLRLLQCPTSGILSAWELGFEIWAHLAKELSSATAGSVEGKAFTEWRNYSGFLASLGGICTAGQAPLLEEPTLSGLRWIDRLSSEDHDEPLLTRYLRLSIRLLACSDVRVREATREVLTAEISPALYQPLFKALESELEALFDGRLSRPERGYDAETIFAEQTSSLLRGLVERLDSPADLGAASSVHLGALTLDFAKFLDGMADNTNIKKVKIKPADGQGDAGMSELKSQMFLTYFTRFLSLLNYEPRETRRNETGVHSLTNRDEGSTTSELAITILSNLLSANIDVGLKHSLNIGYHDNVEIRTAFVKVLYNILIQGTEFNNLSDAAVSEKYDELLDLLTKDIPLAAAMGAVCPTSEVDELTVSLLTIFEHRGLSFQLLESLIKQEVENTENESELLRRNCVATKMLSIYAKWKGTPYLRDTLQKVVERLMLTSNDLDLELDPARVSSSEELQKNALQLQIVAKVFIDDICSSADNMPTSFRKICSIISSAVLRRFPDAKYTAVGAFIFLRFFCPAIVAPEVEGLVTSTPSKAMRRGLLLIAKVVQNLANNVLFGAKEPYMFPLNDFLTQNIYKVTTFLREISVPPAEVDGPASSESFDFGSCVALHRFLYDHWDHVRQRLATAERREYVRSPADMSRGRSPVLEPLRNLVATLGPPPLAVTWNKPQISTNPLPVYSRFQNFMLRNASRGTESFLTSRAVYDGGESKDGLSIICIILRHIDSENIDYDTVLYCYLKLASRLWHRPFGLLIDATCYNGQAEPQDDLFKKLDLLAPVELSRALSRVYIYNMNSTFRKCFRRLLRVSTKASTSAFSPKNVEYFLIGSLQDLQAHFHLSQLNLPRETISVVTDTRYVFQPITRLSKTKGKVEVIIKVGSQFIQVTTAKKSDVFPGFRLHATVNDIFRLGDVDEAQTSIQTEDDSAFGIRADNGRIVMFFTSPQKADILQTIRGAKAKYGKDNRTHKTLERLIRPQDVPGTLLNLALTNISSRDDDLRLASYNLLGALCKAFEFSTASTLMCTKDLTVPSDPSAFIVRMSEQLAQSEPQLTYDFLTEFFVGWDSFSDEQKPLSLAYMAPWLAGLRTYVLVAEPDAEKSREKVSSILRKLVEVALSDHSLAYILEHAVWPAISSDEMLLEILLDEIIKTGLGFRLLDDGLDILSSVIASIGSMTLRGRVLSRLRKALNRSSLRPTKHLAENSVWPEICVLLQFSLCLSFDNGTQAQLYLPDICHIVTMLANTGPIEFRLRVHRFLANTIHSICTSFKLDDARLTKLRAMLDHLGDSKRDLLPTTAALGRDGASASSNQEYSQNLASVERLATLLFDLCTVAAPSVDLSNSWRSRWMSLVASTAFQNNPAIQPRAFAVMGCLAREEVDDDLLYQVLVALRSSVGRFGEEGSSEMLVSIVSSLSKMLSKLPTASRYGLQLFWLAISLLRLVPHPLFNCAAQFLEAVLANISTISDLRGGNMVPHLMQGRSQLEEAAIPLDDVYGVRFSQENFHFAVCACLAKGLTDTVSRPVAMRVLSSFLGMTHLKPAGVERQVADISTSPYFALVLARAPSFDELKDCLWTAGINPSGVDAVSSLRELQDLALIKDKDLLLNSTIELVDFQDLEDAIQMRSLQWLDTLTRTRPGIATHLQEPIMAILDDILLHCQNSATLESAHALLRTFMSSSQPPASPDSSDSLMAILGGMGFSGLWRMCSLNSAWEPDQRCFAMTERLIELIII
ncbi:related to neurofibromin [Cephalotrichum gorgonifer]|uniref:Related to neurofibromin n=1 Tax=Cephalotrichum gorgonifer TaxID=2041049 RepID=A0AAE8MW94_9PEZI|nr:related to neurofibromin [Cephalotrichum gorgonifer]